MTKPNRPWTADGRSGDQAVADFFSFAANISANWLETLGSASGSNIEARSRVRGLPVYAYAAIETLTTFANASSHLSGSYEGNACDIARWARSALQTHTRSIAKLFELFSADEMLLLVFMRHNMVHGHISQSFKGAVQEYKVGQYGIEQIPAANTNRAEQLVRLAPLLAAGPALLNELLERFVNHPAVHWELAFDVINPAVSVEIDAAVAAYSPAFPDQQPQMSPYLTHAASILPALRMKLHFPDKTLRQIVASRPWLSRGN